jgi:hypothetical protein
LRKKPASLLKIIQLNYLGCAHLAKERRKRWNN